jgi:SAM-dependent methyltransferase
MSADRDALLSPSVRDYFLRNRVTSRNPPLPIAAKRYLRWDHARLLELRRRYEGHPAANPSVWNDAHVQSIAPTRFRDDNAFLWQTGRFVLEPNYLLGAYYARQVDVLSLFDRLAEDGMFGARTVDFNGRRLISRDLLDSIVELSFLERHLGISRQPRLQVLDIGAGYGRLAHRLVEALDAGTIYCTDAVAESTFLSEFYLRFRGVGSRAQVVALDEVEALAASAALDLAVNIHSFCECPIAVIEWWLDLIAANDIPNLFIAANGSRLLSHEKDGSRVDFGAAVARRGYRLVVEESYFWDAPSLRSHGIFNDCVFFLFRAPRRRRR